MPFYSVQEKSQEPADLSVHADLPRPRDSGDYFNVFAIADLTVPRLKRSLFLGTRWGDPNAPLVPAPGDPKYLNFTYNPLAVGLGQQTPDTPPVPAASATAPFPSETPWPPSGRDEGEGR